MQERKKIPTWPWAVGIVVVAVVVVWFLASRGAKKEAGAEKPETAEEAKVGEEEGEETAEAAAPQVKVFVFVKASQLWQEKQNSVLWGAEQIGAALKQEVLRTEAMLLAKEDPEAAILEAVASTAVSGREAKCLIKAELRQSGQIVAILEGKSYTMLDPKNPLNLFHQDEILGRLIIGATDNLDLPSALRKVAEIRPPPAEKAEEEKPAEAATPQAPKGGGVPSGWVIFIVLAALVLLVASNWGRIKCWATRRRQGGSGS